MRYWAEGVSLDDPPNQEVPGHLFPSWRWFWEGQEGEQNTVQLFWTDVFDYPSRFSLTDSFPAGAAQGRLYDPEDERFYRIVYVEIGRPRPEWNRAYLMRLSVETSCPCALKYPTGWTFRLDDLVVPPTCPSGPFDSTAGINRWYDLNLATICVWETTPRSNLLTYNASLRYEHPHWVMLVTGDDCFPADTGPVRLAYRLHRDDFKCCGNAGGPDPLNVMKFWYATNVTGYPPTITPVPSRGNCCPYECESSPNEYRTGISGIGNFTEPGPIFGNATYTISNLECGHWCSPTYDGGLNGMRPCNLGLLAQQPGENGTIGFGAICMPLGTNNAAGCSYILGFKFYTNAGTIIHTIGYHLPKNEWSCLGVNRMRLMCPTDLFYNAPQTIDVTPA